MTNKEFSDLMRSQTLMDYLNHLCVKKQLPGFCYKADWEHCGIFWKGTVYFKYKSNGEVLGNIKIMFGKYISDDEEMEYLDDVLNIPEGTDIAFEKRVMLRIMYTVYKAIKHFPPEKLERAFTLLAAANMGAKVPTECIRISCAPPNDYQLIWRP